MSADTTTKKVQKQSPEEEPFRPKTARVKLGQGGRIVLPAEFRHALGMEEGDTLFLHLRKGYIEVSTPESTMLRIQEEVRKYVPEGVSLVDELFKMRRDEARREEEEAQYYREQMAKRKQGESG
ncbi:MAG TPA: AbrB/MazE/SpoVT family DNA-binding domain-containing protein [Thermomicrobiaceae bacterium]|nr:AbrB/MazE/SpoVT family DNA-binding domain-containing protein [Thermomicrobiaceae bacterium]